MNIVDLPTAPKKELMTYEVEYLDSQGNSTTATHEGYLVLLETFACISRDEASADFIIPVSRLVSITRLPSTDADQS